MKFKLRDVCMILVIASIATIVTWLVGLALQATGG